MAMADGVVRAEEIALNQIINTKIGITDIDMNAAKTLAVPEAIEIVKQMDYEQRHFACAFLGAMLAIDGDLDSKELILWGLLTNVCNFPAMSVLEATEIVKNTL